MGCSLSTAEPDELRHGSVRSIAKLFVAVDGLVGSGAHLCDRWHDCAGLDR